MERSRLVPVAMAVAGFVAIGIGIYQGLIHVAPGYEGTIRSGWGGEVNHEEVLLARLGAVAVGGAIAGVRWRYLSIVPFVVGSIVLSYTLRAVFGLFRSPRPLYREHTLRGPGFDSETVVFVLGAEPFLLAAGGLLLVGAGLETFELRGPRRGGDETPA